MAELQERLQTSLGAAYRVEKELGGGGMSRVFLAEEVALGRRVVIKVLPPEMAAGVNAERFRREIQLAASLQHPHVVPLLSAGSSGDWRASADLISAVATPMPEPGSRRRWASATRPSRSSRRRWPKG